MTHGGRKVQSGARATPGLALALWLDQHSLLLDEDSRQLLEAEADSGEALAAEPSVAPVPPAPPDMDCDGAPAEPDAGAAAVGVGGGVFDHTLQQGHGGAFAGQPWD